MPDVSGIQKCLKSLDPGLRRDDRKERNPTFYGTVNL